MGLWREVFSPVFVVRMIIGAFLAGGTAVTIAFFIADYVSKAAHTTGLTTAVNELHGSISSLNGSIRALRTEREELAKSVATEIQRVQRESGGELAPRQN